MKVLQCMAGAEFGGAEAFFIRLAIGLGRAGLDQRVVIRANAERAKLLRGAGIEPDELSFGGPLDVGSGRKLGKMIKQYEPDVVMSWMNRATAAVPEPGGKFVHVGRLGGYYNLKYYRNCDHLAANTEDIADYLVKNGWAPERVHYLPNFVSAEKAAPLSRSTFSTPERTPLILALGRLHENKAFDTLLRAVARVPDAYLWLAGEGPLRGELEELAERLGIKPRVRFLGWRDDAEALFASADIFVCPSRHEPLGNVVIEAWAQGVPVVATDSPGPGTLVRHGESGLLSPVDDVQALARSIQRLVDDPGAREELSRGGQVAYEAEFTEDIVVGKYLDFFEKVTA